MIKTEKIIDIKTGEEMLIEREATAEEIAQAKFLQKEAIERAAKEAEAASAKAALLERLGITEEEAKLLLS